MFNFFRKISLLLFGLFSTQMAHASFIDKFTNLFEENENDWLVNAFIKPVFYGEHGQGQEVVPLISFMLGVFLQGVLIIAGILLAYNIWMGTHDSTSGEVMGKKANASNYILRLSIGGFSLIPLGKSGLCAIQHVIIWLSIQSVFFAGNIWYEYVNRKESYNSASIQFTKATEIEFVKNVMPVVANQACVYIMQEETKPGGLLNGKTDRSGFNLNFGVSNDRKPTIFVSRDLQQLASLNKASLDKNNLANSNSNRDQFFNQNGGVAVGEKGITVGELKNLSNMVAAASYQNTYHFGNKLVVDGRRTEKNACGYVELATSSLQMSPETASNYLSLESNKIKNGSTITSILNSDKEDKFKAVIDATVDKTDTQRDINVIRIRVYNFKEQFVKDMILNESSLQGGVFHKMAKLVRDLPKNAQTDKSLTASRETMKQLIGELSLIYREAIYNFMNETTEELLKENQDKKTFGGKIASFILGDSSSRKERMAEEPITKAGVVGAGAWFWNISAKAENYSRLLKEPINFNLYTVLDHSIQLPDVLENQRNLSRAGAEYINSLTPRMKDNLQPLYDIYVEGLTKNFGSTVDASFGDPDSGLKHTGDVNNFLFEQMAGFNAVKYVDFKFPSHTVSPLLHIRQMGEKMFTWAQSYYENMVKTNQNAIAQGYTDGKGNPNGFATSVFSGNMLVFGMWLSILVPAIMMLYYIPLLPFIYWVGGIVGWGATLLLMMFAAPIMMVAHFIPDRDGVIGKQGQNYGAILVLTMQLPLLVLGYIVAIEIMPVFGLFIDSFFGLAATFFVQDTSPLMNFVGVIMMTGAYVFLYIQVMKRLLGLITMLSDRVMSFMGIQSPVQLSEYANSIEAGVGGQLQQLSGGLSSAGYRLANMRSAGELNTAMTSAAMSMSAKGPQEYSAVEAAMKENAASASSSSLSAEQVQLGTASVGGAGSAGSSSLSAISSQGQEDKVVSSVTSVSPNGSVSYNMATSSVVQTGLGNSATNDGLASDDLATASTMSKVIQGNSEGSQVVPVSDVAVAQAAQAKSAESEGYVSMKGQGEVDVNGVKSTSFAPTGAGSFGGLGNSSSIATRGGSASTASSQASTSQAISRSGLSAPATETGIASAAIASRSFAPSSSISSGSTTGNVNTFAQQTAEPEVSYSAQASAFTLADTSNSGFENSSAGYGVTGASEPQITETFVANSNGAANVNGQASYSTATSAPQVQMSSMSVASGSSSVGSQSVGGVTQTSSVVSASPQQIVRQVEVGGGSATATVVSQQIAAESNPYIAQHVVEQSVAQQAEFVISQGQSAQVLDSQSRTIVQEVGAGSGALYQQSGEIRSFVPNDVMTAAREVRNSGGSVQQQNIVKDYVEQMSQQQSVVQLNKSSLSGSVQQGKQTA